MQKVGIPLIYIRCVRALYGGMRASARGPGGFSPTFPIAQGTREGCILSPLLFLIFFADAVRALERAELDEGVIMLGPLSLVCIFFADDVVLLARCISDLQKLLDAFSDFCNTCHEQIALLSRQNRSCIFSSQVMQFFCP